MYSMEQQQRVQECARTNAKAAQRRLEAAGVRPAAAAPAVPLTGPLSPRDLMARNGTPGLLHQGDRSTSSAEPSAVKASAKVKRGSTFKGPAADASPSTPSAPNGGMHAIRYALDVRAQRDGSSACHQSLHQADPYVSSNCPPNPLRPSSATMIALQQVPMWSASNFV